jgi:hypothetical protein
MTVTTPDETERTFRILTYQAFDAHGLIGSECNGILILDEDEKKVVCDEILKQDSGYFGASHDQLHKADEITRMKWGEFVQLLSEQRNTREPYNDLPTE